MTTQNAKQYLARVLPWPQEGEAPAWVDLCWTWTPPDMKPGQKPSWTGRAVRDLGGAISALDWALTKDDIKDIYVCLSTQRDAKERTGKNNYKYFTPIRGQENAVAIKSLFLDIDFKGGEHGYDTQDQAIEALARFLKETNLPKPSVLVLSGGGIHVYWTLARSLTLAEWRPLAYALAEATKQRELRCDTQCTVDGARILRVPNTFNRKLDAPRPVTLAGDTGLDYSVERIWEALEPYRNPNISALTPQPLFDLPPPSKEFLAKFNGTAALSAGIEPEYPPIKLEDIASECPFISDALATGGKDLINPLWNLTNLISVFTEGGIADAHRMGNQHPGYTKESTDEQFERKAREKAEKGLGWPACATISGHGSKACQGCKHFAQGKTPIHAALRASSTTPAPTALCTVGVPSGANAQAGVAQIVTSQVIPPSAPANDLPNGYGRDQDGMVCIVGQDDDGKATYERIVDYTMEDAWLQRDPGMFHFKAKVEKGALRKISIPFELVGAMGMRSHLQEQSFMLPIGNRATENVARLMMAWIKLLHETADSVKSAPFGWTHTGSTLDGFVYGGQLWGVGGSKSAATGDPEIARQYAPCGSAHAWVDAAKMITDQERPELDALLASAFGAPLVAFTGEPGVLMSAYSKESGIGKTTTLRIAQAVWGSPVTAMQSLDDTSNATMHKLGQIKSLPLYWDELKTEEHTKKFVNITFQTTQGKEKARLGRTIHQREPGTWQTLLVSASNDSLLDHVTQHTSTTTAGLYRIFEYAVPPGSKGQLVPSDAALMVAKLNTNYGAVGLEYAKFLGAHHPTIAKDMELLLQQLHAETGSKSDERFWLVSIAAIILGARYANHLGFTQIDAVALKNFMLDSLLRMRGQLTQQPVDMAQELNVANVLAQFLAAMRAKHTLYTNRIHVGRGKPAKDSVKIDTARCDPQRIDGAYVQVGVTDYLLRISRAKLCEWLTEKGFSAVVYTRALVEEYNAQHINGRMCAGVDRFSRPTEYVYEINLQTSPSINFLDA
jgi:hypothetical protein